VYAEVLHLVIGVRISLALSSLNVPEVAWVSCGLLEQVQPTFQGSTTNRKISVIVKL
jgi:hypothetical protein